MLVKFDLFGIFQQNLFHCLNVVKDYKFIALWKGVLS